MRKLAIFAFSFSAAVFCANYLLPAAALLPAGGLLVPVGLLLLVLLRRHGGRRLAVLLVCAGLSAGLLWTAAYAAMVFRPAQAMDDRTVRMTAEVADWPRKEEYGYSVLVRSDTDTAIRLSAIVYLDEQGAELRPGDRISTVAHCTVGDRTFSGEEITYYTAKGIFIRAQAYGRVEIQRPERVPLRNWPAVLSQALKDGIDAAFPADAAPLVKGIVTGDRDDLTDEFTASLRRIGLAHTVAVSGMHLAFLSSMLTALLGRGKRSTAVVCVVWVLVFCGVAGNTPSVTRAAVMIVMLQIAPLLGREPDGITSLTFALFLLLVWNPFSAAHVGLQLSFAAVAGILLVSDRMQDWLLDKLRLSRRPRNRWARQLIRVPRFLVCVLAATLGASVFTVPLVALYFQLFSLISPLANLLALWTVSVLFGAGLVLGSLGAVCSGPASILAIPFTALARYLGWVVNRLGRIPLAAVCLDSFYYRSWMVLFCLLVGLTFVMKGKKRPIIPCCAAAVTLTAAVLFTAMVFQAGSLTAVVLDVGQGQSILLRMGGYLVMMDCGGSGSDNAGDTAADYIQSRGWGTLDFLVLSHYHEDHANGIPQLLRRLDVSVLVVPDVEEDSALRGEILALAEERGVEVWFVREDTEISFGEDQRLTIFAPLGQGTQTNELGLTVLASAGEFDVLITGDMGGEVEKLLLEHAALPDIELLAVGHHGSKYSTTRELLETAKPEAAVVSAGAGNLYGHPAQETLERLDEAGADIYRTDLQGTVCIRASG